MHIISTLRNLAMGVAVGILLPLTTNYGVNVFAGRYPQVSDYGQQYDQKKHKFTFPSEEKEKQYKQALYRYETIYFSTTAIIGLITLIASAFTNIAFLSIGFILGGVSCLTMGYITYWNNFNDILRFVSLLFALILLIFISYRIAGKEK